MAAPIVMSSVMISPNCTAVKSTTSTGSFDGISSFSAVSGGTFDIVSDDITNITKTIATAAAIPPTITAFFVI